MAKKTVFSENQIASRAGNPGLDLK